MTIVRVIGILFFFILISRVQSTFFFASGGSPTGFDPLPDPNSDSNLSVSSIFGNVTEPYAEISWIGTSKFDSDEIESTNGVYEIQVESAISSIQMRVSIGGYSNWNLGMMQLPFISDLTDFGNSSTTIGQTFLMINDNLRILTINEVTQKNGFGVVLPVGDHTISILYLIMTSDSTIKYAFDAKIVRLRPMGEEFEPYKTQEVPLKYNVMDLQNSGVIKLQAIRRLNVSGEFDSYERIFSLPNQNDVQIKLNDERIEDASQLFIAENDQLPDVEISGSINSSGFNGIQLLRNWESVKGISFFVDSAGISDNIPNNVILRQGLNHLGVLTISPYGFWHQNIQFPTDSFADGFPYGIVDWDWLTRFHLSTEEDTESRITFDSSFDFAGTFDGVVFTLNIEDHEIVTESNKAGLSLDTYLTLIILIVIFFGKRTRRSR